MPRRLVSRAKPGLARIRRYQFRNRVKARGGVFALTGSPASMRISVATILSAGAGSFVVSGQPASLRRAGKLPAAAGAYQVTGTPIEPSETTSLLARFTTPADATRSALINNLIVLLKAQGLWAKLDALYILAAHDAQAARQNWIQNAYNLTAVSSPTFTTDRGYTGDGAAAYLSTGAAYNGLAKFAPNSASYGVFARTTVNNYPFGAVTNPATVARFDTSQMRLNDGTNSAHGLGTTGGRLLSFDRPGSGTKKSYANGGAVNTASVASATPGSDVIALLRTSTVYSNTQLAAAFYGASLGDAGHAALYAAILTYLQAVGAA